MSQPPSSTLFPYTTLFRSACSALTATKKCTTCIGRKVSRRSAMAAAQRSILYNPNQKGGGAAPLRPADLRSEEHTSELQSRENLVCRLLLEKKKKQKANTM